MVLGIRQVLLAIPRDGEEAACAFYVSPLEMEEVEKPAALAGGGGCWLRSGGAHVHR